MSEIVGQAGARVTGRDDAADIGRLHCLSSTPSLRRAANGSRVVEIYADGQHLRSERAAVGPVTDQIEQMFRGEV